MAITQPGGAGTVIILNDDTDGTNHAAAPGPHTWAEIAAAFPADFISNTANTPQYKATVNVQLGNSANTTTLTDATDADVAFNNTRGLTYGGTSTARFLNLGTKIGSGNQASGTNGGRVTFGASQSFSCTWKLYGAKFKITTGALTFGTITASVNEMINCLVQSTSGAVAPFILGLSGFPIGNIYNCDFTHTTSNQMVTNTFVDNFERVTFGGTALADFFRSGSADIAIKDMALFGSPTIADLRWGTSGAVRWRVVRPVYTGTGNPKYGAVGAQNFALSEATQELWPYDVKVVRGDGTGVAGIPVKLTDVTGAIQVNTVTDATGQITIGSGITTGCVTVMDHYPVAGVYTQRHRSPFLTEVNTGAGANPSYNSYRYYWYWPGYSTVTLTAGAFESMNDIIPLEYSAGTSTSWVEVSI